MVVLNEIIQNSAIGDLSKGYRGVVLFLFSTIVTALFIMFIYLMVNGSQMNFSFGY